MKYKVMAFDKKLDTVDYENLLLVLSVFLQSACGVKGKLDSLDSKGTSYLVAKFEDSSKSFMSAQVD